MTRSALVGLVSVLALGACSDRKSSGDGGLSAVKKLHRGELAAVASYDQALEKISADKKVELARIRDEHKDAVGRLAERVVALKGTPDASGGAWQSWSEFWTKAGAAFGDDAAIRALEAGEKLGQADYDAALRDDALDATTVALVRDTLRPRQDEHLRALRALVKS